MRIAKWRCLDEACHPASVFSPPKINTPMISSFKSWEKQRRHLAPEAERMLPLVAAAGTVGMNRRQLGNALDLDHETLDQLLAGLVGIGLLTVAWVRGVPVYRAGIMDG